MKYISAIIEPKYMSVGGFGHIFYDVLSAYIISKIFSLRFVYSPIQSLGEKHHLGEQFGYTEDSINWDMFLQFDKDELRIKDIENLNLNKVTINLCEPFKSMDIKKIENLINSAEDNTLFILTNNNRVFLNELYYFNNPIYQIVFQNLKTKLEHVKSPRNDTQITIAMHIRRGDWDWQPLKYNVEFIKLWQLIHKDQNYIINVYSLGTEKQLEEIKTELAHLDENIIFHFNTDVFDTFRGIYNADIVVGGHSNFAKIITMFSNNTFIYLPYKDGVIKALGVNNKFKLFHNGQYPELFDKDNRFETDIHLIKNKQLIIDKLSSL
jgi:hypothetical protein